MTKIWPCDDEESTRSPIFTRANTGAVFVEAAMPLTWSASLPAGPARREPGDVSPTFNFTDGCFSGDIAGGPVAAYIQYTWPRVYLDHLLARLDEQPA